MLWRKASASHRRSALAEFYVAASTRFVERYGVTPCARGAHACPAENWGVRGEGQAEAVRSREEELVGVVRGGSVGLRARVPEPAGGRVQCGDGGAEKSLSSLGGRLAVALGECSGFACTCCGCF